ncbi:MAG: lasso peptide biosynthesis B2 protein [Chloroflexi bacterium]|nr:lasso peptide biosynthesis B2 protein [Chloroflexota bacterium]
MWRRVFFIFSQPHRIVLVMAVMGWHGLLSLLRPFIKLERLVSIAVPQKLQPPHLRLDDVMVMLHWLNALGAKRGDCLVKALVGYRFLYLAGETPVMVIGMKPPGQGHAWLENNGRLILQHPSRIDGFIPILKLDQHRLEPIHK